MIERLRDAEALFRFDRNVGRTALVGVASDLLLQGVSSAGFVALAGDDHADLDEVERDLRSSHDVFRLAPLDMASAAIWRCRSIAREVIEGRRPASATAGLIWAMYVAADFPDELSEFAYVADGLDDLPGLISEQEYLAAAEHFLARTDGWSAGARTDSSTQSDE